MYTDFLLHHYGGSLCVFSFSRSAANNINLRLTISREMFMQISLILYVRALISSFIPLAYVNGNSFLSRSIPQPAIQKWVKSQYRKWNWNFFSSLHWFRVFYFRCLPWWKSEIERERKKLGQVKRISDKSKTSLWGLIAHCGLFLCDQLMKVSRHCEICFGEIEEVGWGDWNGFVLGGRSEIRTRLIEVWEVSNNYRSCFELAQCFRTWKLWRLSTSKLFWCFENGVNIRTLRQLSNII
jgi:hypothetical protein